MGDEGYIVVFMASQEQYLSNQKGIIMVITRSPASTVVLLSGLQRLSSSLEKPIELRDLLQQSPAVTT